MLCTCFVRTIRIAANAESRATAPTPSVLYNELTLVAATSSLQLRHTRHTRCLACGLYASAMKSFDFKADRHKLIAHRGSLSPPPPAGPPPAKPGRPSRTDLLDRLIEQHPLLHHIELLIPSSTPPPLSLPSPPCSYHISARLTSFLSSSFLLPLLASGSLAAFSLSTPVDRCNSFTLLSTTSANHPSSTATAAAAATVTLTLDEDTYQQLGLAGQALPAQPGFHVVSVPIQPSSWQPSSRLYQRVHICLAALAEVELLVQHISHDGQVTSEAQLTAEGVRVIKRVDSMEQRWQSEQPLALPDVGAVWLAGCDGSDKGGMLRQQRKDAQQLIDQLDVELVDWIGLATNRIVDLLPTHTPDSHSSTTFSPPSTSLVDNAFCTSLPLLHPTTATLLTSVRYTGLLSHGHLWRSLLSHGWTLLPSQVASAPWVCIVAGSVVDAGNVVGVDGSGNGEDNFCVVVLPDGRYLLYQLANVCTSIH